MIIDIKDDFNLQTIAQSGQCFRFNPSDDGYYKIVACGKILRIRELEKHRFEFDCSKKDFDCVWYDYFDLATAYSKIRSSVKNDAFLLNCAGASEGMRMLKQDIWEMTVSFIISQRKSIPAIKTSIERLCELCGDKISDHDYAFPTPIRILSADKDKLASCGLGYRLPYILSAAETF